MSDTNAADAATLARFTAAEDRLYPLAMVDSDRYQQATALVGLTVADLRQTCPDLAAVLARREVLVAGLAAAAAESGRSLVGLQAETVVDCASALRYRELEAERAETAARERVTAAREAGQEWLVDEPSAAEAMAGVMRRIETHLPSGTVLFSSVEVDSAGAPFAYTLQVLAAPTGPGATPDGDIQAFGDRDSWLAAAEVLRAQIAQGS